MIKIIKGNLFDIKADVICHQVNCQGRMNSGVALQIKQRYPEVYADYHKAYREARLQLGRVILSPIKNSNRYVANLCGQDNYGYDGKMYTNYEKLQECLNKLKYIADAEVRINKEKLTFAFPYKMSCDRGGGDWNVVYKMIEETLKDYNVEIWRL